MWKYKFHVPETKQVRLLVYTDCANEADDQYAVAHVLMTQKFDVVGIIAAHFDMNTRREGAPYAPGTTAQASYDEILDRGSIRWVYPDNIRLHLAPAYRLRMRRPQSYRTVQR